MYSGINFLQWKQKHLHNIVSISTVIIFRVFVTLLVTELVNLLKLFSLGLLICLINIALFTSSQKYCSKPIVSFYSYNHYSTTFYS